MLLQQGDILVKNINAFPGNLSIVVPVDNRLIIAKGEATGHCHVINDINNVQLLKDKDGNLFLDVKKTTDLIHQEHNPILIEPGKYRIDIVREYDHFEEKVRGIED